MKHRMGTFFKWSIVIVASIIYLFQYNIQNIWLYNFLNIAVIIVLLMEAYRLISRYFKHRSEKSQ